MSGSGKWWPAGIVALLLVPIVADAILVVRAVGDPAQAVEPDYYKKALAWDERQAAQSASDALGWTARVAATAAASGELSLTLELADRHGHPVAGAVVAVEGYAIARSADRMTAVLAPAGPGTYTGVLPRARAGLWQVQVEAQHGDSAFLLSQRLEVASRPPS